MCRKPFRIDDKSSGGDQRTWPASTRNKSFSPSSAVECAGKCRGAPQAELLHSAVCTAPINSAVGTCGTKKGNPFEHIMKELLEISYQVHEWGTRLIWYYVLWLGSFAPRLRFVSDGRKLIKMNTYLLGWRRCVLFSRVSSKGLCDGRRAVAIRCLMSGKVERDNEWRNFSMVLDQWSET